MRKQMYNSLLLCILLSTGAGRCYSQNLDSLITLQRMADPQEKIYVHFDKQYYNPGETIWFKAYIFDGLERALGVKNFYAELLDESGAVFSRLTAPIGESSAAGNFELPATINKNLLYFRAYTIPMLNGDTNFLYIKPLKILVPQKTVRTKTVLPAVIQFLPEGGDLIAELNTVLAFKVTDANGVPVNAKGMITEENGTKISDFVTVHDGMGTLKIIPKAGQHYKAIWKDANGKSYTTPLPEIKTQGVSLQLSEIQTGKKFILQRTENIEEESKALRIIAYMNQQLVYYAKINLSENTATSGIIPIKQLPTGILTVTVFDKNFKPLAERVSFVNNHDYEFDADAWIPVLNKNKRGLNTMEMQISDTFRSNLSIAVTDADLNVNHPHEDNIVSHLLLTGDLRGKITNPYYYFFNSSDSATIYLDMVMLTNGWRRYNWDRVIASKLPPNRLKESNYLSLEGKLIGMQPGIFSADTKLTGILQTKDSVKNFLSLPVDRKGQVKSDGFIFYDYAKLYFQFNDKNLVFDKSLLQVNNGLYKSANQLFMNEENRKTGMELDTNLIAKNIKLSSEEMKVALQRARKEKEQVLQEVVVKGKVKTNEQKMDEKYASGLFSGGDAHSFDVADDPFGSSAISVFQYLQGKVAGLQITTNGPTPSLSWRGSTPVVYLDEIESDPSIVNNINMNDVAYIKVFNPGSAGAIRSSGGGAIVVYTKKGSDRPKDEKSKGLSDVQLTGYTLVKQFYAPDYASPGFLSDLPDLRTTLYWNPYILLDKNKKKLKIQFYNNDVTHRFRIIMEGINANDKLAHIEKVIE